MRIQPSSDLGGREDAYAIWDMVGVVAGVCLAGAIGIAWAGGAGRDSRSVLCLANLRQLARGWSLYAADHGGRLPVSGGAGVVVSSNTWAPGWLDFTRSPQNFDVAGTLAKGQIWKYVGQDARAYRCPEDSTGVRTGANFTARIRSYSMNGQMTGSGGGSIWNPVERWKLYRKMDQFADDEPSRRFVFAEEHPGSINDDMMIVDMTGYPTNPGAMRMLDVPAAFHSGSCAFVFADEHAEMKAWEDARTSPSVTDRVVLLNVPQPSNPDIRWMQERTTRAVLP